ncbi:unnamed protein product, partial [Notodromas monacha]
MPHSDRQHPHDAKAAVLPPNWEMRYDPLHGRCYFVDHNTKTTSWTDPRITAAKQRQKENAETHAAMRAAEEAAKAQTLITEDISKRRNSSTARNDSEDVPVSASPAPTSDIQLGYSYASGSHGSNYQTSGAQGSGTVDRSGSGYRLSNSPSAVMGTGTESPTMREG